MGQQSNEDQAGGGNVVGKAPSGTLYQPPAIMGKSGKPDNSPTDTKQLDRNS